MSRDDFDDFDLEEEGAEVLILVGEDGEEYPFELIAELEIDDNLYVVLLPIVEDEEEEEEEAEVLIYKASYDEEGNLLLSEIEDEEEWNKVSEAWEELVESEQI